MQYTVERENRRFVPLYTRSFHDVWHRYIVNGVDVTFVSYEQAVEFLLIKSGCGTDEFESKFVEPNIPAEFPRSETLTQQDGWIDPQGGWWPCGTLEHASFAAEQGATVSQLERKGWCHISGLEVCNQRFRPSQAQLDTLWDMYILKPDSWMGRHLKHYFGGE